MNRLFFLPFFLLLTALSFAQSDTSKFRLFDKGKNIVGLQLSGGWGGGRVVGQIHLRYGRFWLKKLNAGLETGFSSNGQYFKSGYIRPFGRYYILNKKLAPFVEANYSYGVSKQTNGLTGNLKEEWNGSANSISALGGLAYTGILKRFGLELYGGYYYSTTHIKNHPTYNSYSYDSDGFTYGLRINFHFCIDK